MRVADRLASPIGLTGSRWMMLCVVAEAGRPISLSELSERILLSVQNISRMVQTLEAEGLVTRLTKPGSGRSIFVELTPAGLEARNKVKQLGERLLGRMLDGFDAERVARLEKDFEDLISNVLVLESQLISDASDDPKDADDATD